MSDSSEGIESRSFYENSDGEGSETSSLASSLASHLQGRPKRQRPAQIVGKAWVLHGEITINQSLSDSFEAKVQNTKSRRVYGKSAASPPGTADSSRGNMS